MKSKTTQNNSGTLKARTLLIISLVATAVGLLDPIMLIFGAVFFLFAVNAFVMEKYNKKLPKIFISMNKKSDLAALTILALFFIFIVILANIMSNKII